MADVRRRCAVRARRSHHPEPGKAAVPPNNESALRNSGRTDRAGQVGRIGRTGSFSSVACEARVMLSMPHSRWFLPCDTPSPPDGRIFCFAAAGGDPRAFLDWQPSLGADAEILAVCLPGRGHRADESAPASIAELADGAAAAISACTGQPIYLFGHSFGALVAFEVARRLGSPSAFRHLIASGCAAPSLLPSDYNVWAAGNK